MKRILDFFRLRRARKLGEGAGARLAQQREANWQEVKQIAFSRPPNSAGLRALIIGWMNGLHETDEPLLNSPATETQFRTYWADAVAHFADRFHSEVVTALLGPGAATVLSGSDIAQLIENPRVLVDALARTIQEQQAAALDQGVRAIRAAEEDGTITQVPENDEQLKESLRQLWNGELGDQQERQS